MKASITFLIIWFGFIVLGTIGSILMHMDISTMASIRVWLTHDLVYILLIGWAFAAIIIVYLYLLSSSKAKKKDTATEGKQQ